MDSGKPMRFYREERSPGYENRIVRADHHFWRSPNLSTRGLWLRCSFSSVRGGRWKLSRAGFPYLLAELVTEGSLRYHAEGRIFPVKTNEIQIIPPGLEYSVEPLGDGLCGRLGLELCGAGLPSISESLELNHARTIRTSEPERYRGLWEKIDRLLTEKPLGGESTVCGLCMEYLSGLADENRNRGLPGLASKRLRDILNFIQANLAVDLSCGVLAEKANCSLPTLNRLFLSQLGKTPQTYINESRLTCARDLLELGDMTVKEISVRLGYKNQFYFSRVFKAKYGVPPADFHRKSVPPPG